jgi:hypothetical protein
VPPRLAPLRLGCRRRLLLALQASVGRAVRGLICRLRSQGLKKGPGLHRRSEARPGALHPSPPRSRSRRLRIVAVLATQPRPRSPRLRLVGAVRRRKEPRHSALRGCGDAVRLRSPHQVARTFSVAPSGPQVSHQGARPTCTPEAIPLAMSSMVGMVGSFGISESKYSTCVRLRGQALA